MRHLKFAAGYCAGQWVAPFYVTLDKEGTIVERSGVAPAGAVEEHSGYLLPGLPNAHSHSFQYAMAGMAERVLPGREKDDFWFWREQMYTLASKIDETSLLAVTTRLYMSLLENGYTSICEFHYLQHQPGGQAYADPARLSQVLMEAARLAGIHLTLIPVFYQQASPGVPIKPQQLRFHFPDVASYAKHVSAVEASGRAYPEVTVGSGVHSMRSAGLNEMKEILGRPLNKGPLHLHASEQVSDVKGFEDAYKVRPIAWLSDNIDLNARHNLVHATHLTDREVTLLAKSGATVVLCPSTEANLGDGIFPIMDYRAQGGSWSIGSDSHVNLSPFLEMQIPETTQRFLQKRRNVFCQPGELDSGALLYREALQGGRLSLGLPSEDFAVGSAFEGVVLDADHDRLLGRPLASVLGILLFAPERDMVRDVFARGSMRVKNGRHIGRAAQQPAYQSALKQLMQGLT